MPAVAWIVAALVVFAFLGDGNPVDGVVTAVNEVTRGPRLTHSPADSTGLVTASIDDLVAESGASSDASYSAARMLGSEEPRTDAATQAAICWCLINEASRRGIGITQLLTNALNPRNDGSYGSQKDKDPNSANFGKSDRYATTALDPYTRELDIAEQCLDGTIPDPTGGCNQFDRAGEEAHPDVVAANRIKNGSVLASVPTADAGIRFWRPA